MTDDERDFLTSASRYKTLINDRPYNERISLFDRTDRHDGNGTVKFEKTSAYAYRYGRGNEEQLSFRILSHSQLSHDKPDSNLAPPFESFQGTRSVRTTFASEAVLTPNMDSVILVRVGVLECSYLMLGDIFHAFATERPLSLRHPTTLLQTNMVLKRMTELLHDPCQ